MKPFRFAARLILGAALVSTAANAGILATFTSSLALTDPAQVGRLSRNGIAQDWIGDEAFPGMINTSTTYHYQTFTVNVGKATFIQIEMDSLSGNTFASVYDTAYLPNSAGGTNFGFDINWLGDAGASGNAFGTDPIFFQVIVPQYEDIVLVVNNTAAPTGGIGDPFTLTVEGFIDSSFDDVPTPEPASVLAGAGGLLLLAAIKRRRSIA